MDIILGQTIVSGRYKILSSLGGGAFGQTYIAEDLQLPDRPHCVVKQLKPQATDQLTLDTARRLFDTEAKVLHRLGSHDQIPRLLAHFEDQEDFFLVQELIEGTPLSEETIQGKRFSESYAIALLQDVLSTLAFVHQQNAIHRDLKPANIIRRASDRKLVLIDFGAAKQVSSKGGSEGLTIAIGTPGYMPNEQLAGSPRHNSDIYAVGAIAIQALTGIPPYLLPQHPQTCDLIWRDKAQVSPELADILDKMVCFYLRNRYQSAPEVLADLSNLVKKSKDETDISSTKQMQETSTQSNTKIEVKKLLYVLVPGAIAGLVVAGLMFFRGTDNLKLANQLIDQQKFTSAIATLDKVLDNQPNNPNAWKIRGDVLFLTERYDAALSAYQKASEIEPNDPKVWNNQGETLYKLNRSEDALKAHDKSLELDKNNIQALNGRGFALIGLKRYNEAIDAFDKARQLQPNNPEAWENRGLALQFLQRPNDARKAYEESLASYNDKIRGNPNALESLVNRGRVLSKLQRHQEAIASFEDAIKSQPDFFPAWVAKGSTLVLLRQPDEALKAYDKALEIRPDSHITWHNRGSLLSQMGRLEDAIKDYDKALEIEPKFVPASSDRGFALLQLQRPTDALSSFDKALDIDKNDNKSWTGRGMALAEQKRYDEGLASFDKAIAIAPGDPIVWLNRGSTLEKMQRNEDALNAYNKVLEITPNFPPALDARQKLQQKLER